MHDKESSQVDDEKILHRTKLIEGLSKTLRKIDLKSLGISEVHLFGSTIKGTDHKNSDVDLAFLSDNFKNYAAIAESIITSLDVLLKGKVNIKINNERFKDNDKYYDRSYPTIEVILIDDMTFFETIAQDNHKKVWSNKL